MSILTQLRALELGPPQVSGSFTAYPLLARAGRAAGYETLDRALRDKTAEVTEISESGSVGQLRVKNGGKRPLLIPDGEELVGAKQNRIVNLSIMVAAESSLQIPVTCVEQGRWRHESRSFSSAGRTHYASARAMTLSAVSASMASDGSRRSDPHAVWRDIEAKSSRMRVRSDTQASSVMYDRARPAIAELGQALTPLPGQVGAVFAIDGVVVGLEAFDSEQTWSVQAPKLAQSYGL